MRACRRNCHAPYPPCHFAPSPRRDWGGELGWRAARPVAGFWRRYELQIAKCKVKNANWRTKAAAVRANLQFAICILQFAMAPHIPEAGD